MLYLPLEPHFPAPLGDEASSWGALLTSPTLPAAGPFSPPLRAQISDAQITQPSPRWLKRVRAQSAPPGMKRIRVFLQTQVQCLHGPRAAGRERSQEGKFSEFLDLLFGSSCLETCFLLEAGVRGSFLSSCRFRCQGWKSLDATEHPLPSP